MNIALTGGMTLKKLITAIIMLTAAVLLLCACTPEQTTVQPTQTQSGQTEQATPSGREFLYDKNGNVIQQPQVRDYTAMWWRDGFNRGGKWQMNMQTGYYGMSVSTLTGTLNTFGAIEQEISESEAGKANNELIDSLAHIRTRFAVIDESGERCGYSGMEAVGGGSITSRILESGRYMQRIDVMSMKFSGIDKLRGRVEYAATPEHMSIEFSLFSPDEKTEGKGLELRLVLPESYTEQKSSCSGRALTVSEPGGAGFSIILPAQEGVSLKTEEGEIVITCTGLTLAKNTFTGFGVVLLPSVKASTQDAINYITREALEVSAVEVSPNEGKTHEAAIDTSKGYLSVNIDKMMNTQTGEYNNKEEDLLKYDRLRFTITNSSAADIKLPIQFYKEKKFGVEGFAPMLRDAQTGEPIGVQVQLSKNWHSYSSKRTDATYAAKNDPKRYWSGTWFHGYTMLDIPAGKSVTYELCISYATWGGVYSASHSQLCLAGWGGNFQQWETSAIGSFGESFCYDPEMAHGTRAFVNDILPFLTYGVSGEKYNWSNGVSGAGFLNYYNAQGEQINMKSITTRFMMPGPVMTQTVYTMVTQDEAIAAEYTVNMSGTDDAARVWHSFKYTFLKDTEFSRLAFYSLGTDNYNTSYSRVRVGNLDGPCDITLGDTVYKNGDISTLGLEKGYIGAQVQQRAEIPGKGLYVLFRDCEKYVEAYGRPANKMMDVVFFEASINGKTYDKPALSINMSTPAFGTAYLSPVAELCPAAEVGDTLKAGSTVCGTVVFTALPTHNGEGENGYYGTNPAVLDLPKENYAEAVCRLFVQRDAYEAEAVRGEIKRKYPLSIEAQENGAEVVISGGNGYLPVTVTGLDRPFGFTAQVFTNGEWASVSALRGVSEGECRQCYYNSATGKYELTFALACAYPDTVLRFRLVDSAGE